jgi:putative membrane protein
MTRNVIVWATIFLGVLLWSAYEPTDWTIWVLEVAPAVIGAVVLAFTRKRFPLTTLT